MEVPNKVYLVAEALILQFGKNVAALIREDIIYKKFIQERLPCLPDLNIVRLPVY